MKYDITKIRTHVEGLIDKIENLHHRAILENYRMHAMLEVSGRYEEVLSPALTVEQPFYRVSTPEDGFREYDGMDAVHDLVYKPLADGEAAVFTKEREKLAVADWGFSQEYLIHNHLSGRAAIAKGLNVANVDAFYVESRWLSAHWEYDPSARLIGEHLYYSAPVSVKEVRKEDFLSPDNVRARLAPIIAAGPYRK